MASNFNRNKRHSVNVGVGILRDPDDDHFTINQGWDPSQVHMPDNSVIDSLDFEAVPDNKSDNGPHTFTLPSLPNMFLDTSTLRVMGKAKIVYIHNTDGESVTLPKQSEEDINPWTKGDFYFKKSTLAAVSDELKKNSMKTQPSVFIAKAFKEKTEPKKDPQGNVIAGETVKSFEADATDSAYIMYSTKRYNKKFAKVAPINHFMQSMWKDIEIKMNGTVVTKNANLEYPIRTYLENLLYYGNDAQKTHMSTEMWDPDIYVDEDNPESWNLKLEGDLTATPKQTPIKSRVTSSENKAFFRRRARYCNNEEFDFVFSMHTELNTINSFIYDGVNYQFKFIRNNMDFCLLSALPETEGRYVLRLTDFRLRGRYMIPSPKIETALRNYISKNMARYATRRNQVFTNFIPKGSTDFLYPNVFTSDVLPDQILMVMMSAKAKNGDLRENPWYFEHYNVSKVRLQVNQRTLPTEGLNPNFEKNWFAETYRELFENLGIGNNNIGIPLTPLQYKYGSTIFAWDLNHDKCAGMHNNHSKMNGIVDLKLTFAKPLPDNVAVVVMGIYRDYLTLDSERQPNIMSSYGVGALPKNAFAPAAG